MSETGKELQENNEQIVYFLNLLRNQRREIDFLIDKQEEEKNRLEMEIERIYYKLTLICKSLATRKKARVYYDQTIKELEEHYRKIVESSGVLLNSVKMGAGQLEQIMDKKIGTGSLDGDDRVPIIPGPSKDEAPTKDSNTVKPTERPPVPVREERPPVPVREEAPKPPRKRLSPLPAPPPPIQEEPTKEEAQAEDSTTWSSSSDEDVQQAANKMNTATVPPPIAPVTPTSTMSTSTGDNNKDNIAATQPSEDKEDDDADGEDGDEEDDQNEDESTEDENSAEQIKQDNPTTASQEPPSKVPQKETQENQDTYLVVEKLHDSENEAFMDDDSLEPEKRSKTSLASYSSTSDSSGDGMKGKTKKKGQNKHIEHDIPVKVEKDKKADLGDVVVLKKVSGKDSSLMSLTDNKDIFSRFTSGRDQGPANFAKLNTMPTAAKQMSGTEDSETDSEPNVFAKKFGKQGGGSVEMKRRRYSGDA